MILRYTNPSPSGDGVSQYFISRDPPSTRALVPSGSDDSINYDQQVDSTILKSPSNKDPWVEWDNVFGNEHAKEELYTNMVEALQRKDRLVNVLLFGPPGTGKSMLAFRAARLADWTVFNLTLNTIRQKNQGQSEK